MSMISRDPFARTELHRKRERVPDSAGCAWCGHINGTDRNKLHLFRYRVESDGGTVSVDTRLFCSKSCRQTYIGG